MSLTKVNPTVLDTPSVTVNLAADSTPGGIGVSVTTAQTTANTADTRSKIYDLASGTVGKPGAGATILRFVAPRAFTLPVGLTGSFCKANAAATALSSFTIKKNGSSIGTVNFAAASATATFTFASATSFAPGDVLSLDAPGSADSTLSDLYYTLSATLV